MCNEYSCRFPPEIFGNRDDMREVLGWTRVYYVHAIKCVDDITVRAMKCHLTGVIGDDPQHSIRNLGSAPALRHRFIVK